jgi:predicted NodU family carbamoyl transferase
MSFGMGRDCSAQILEEICFPDMVGGLYSSFTHQLGFREDQEGNTIARAPLQRTASIPEWRATSSSTTMAGSNCASVGAAPACPSSELD